MLQTWKRADQRLGTDAKEYWSLVPIHAFQRADPDYVAVDALLKHGRPRAAIACLAARENDKLPLDPNRAMDALLCAVNSKELGTDTDTYGIESVIKALQDNKNTDAQRLISVEWAYLALLEHSHLATAKTLNAAIATDPKWFCEIIRMIFRSDRETDTEQKPERIYRLPLHLSTAQQDATDLLLKSPHRLSAEREMVAVLERCLIKFGFISSDSLKSIKREANQHEYALD